MGEEAKIAYWSEIISECAAERGIVITDEQLPGFAEDMFIASDTMDQAFPVPSSLDWLGEIEREHQRKLKAVERERDEIRRAADTVIRREIGAFPNTPISYNEYGEVFTHSGRTEQVR